jgi:beta-galactosidase
VGYRGGKETGAAILRTARDVSQVVLTADRADIKADGQDLSYVSIELKDATGTRHPRADNLLEFHLEGPGSIVGIGNANPMSVESYQRPPRKAWQGRCLVIVKSTKRPGEIRLRVSSAGLPAGETTIRSVS